MVAPLGNVSLGVALQDLELKRLKAIADYLGLDSSFASRARLISEIPRALLEASPEQLLRGLTRAEGYELSVIMALEASAEVLGDSFFRKAGPRVSADGLLSRGLVVNDRAVGGPRVPVELREKLAAGLDRSFQLRPVKPPATHFTGSYALAVVDLTTAWVELLKRPLPLTKTGFISRRGLGRLARLFSTDDEEAPLYDVFNAIGMSRLTLLLNFALSGRLIARKGGVFVAERAAIERVTAGFPGLLKELLAGAPAGAGAAAALTLSALDKQPTGRWFKFADVERLVKRRVGETGPAGCAHVFSTLFVLGVLSAGFSDGGLALSRVADIFAVGPVGPPAEGGFFVGANFEVQVPAGISPAARLKLEAFADLKSAGHYLTYVISKGSFYRALDDGLECEDMVEFLRDGSAKELPQNLVFTLRDWAGHYGEVGFVEGTYLVAGSAARLEEVSKLPALRGKLGEPVKLFGFKIDAGDYEDLREAVTDAGFLPTSLKRLCINTGIWRAVFRGRSEEGARRPSSTALGPGDMLRSAVAFALEEGRRMKFYLRTGGAVEGVPAAPFRKGFVKVALYPDGEISKVPISDIEDFEVV